MSPAWRALGEPSMRGAGRDASREGRATDRNQVHRDHLLEVVEEHAEQALAVDIQKLNGIGAQLATWQGTDDGSDKNTGMAKTGT